MVEMIEANWLLFLIAFLIGVAIAWYIFNVRRKTRVAADRRDVLDEGADRAKRNQAFIDAPPRPAGGAASPLNETGDAPPAEKPLEPRGTASIPTPGAIFGAETAVNAAAGTPTAIGRAEQEEADRFRRQQDAPNASEPLNPESSGSSAEVPAGFPPSIIKTQAKETDPEAAAEPAAASALVAATTIVEPPGTSGPLKDDLTRVKGIGPKLAVRLNELGVHRLDQIAAWDDGDIDRIDPQLGRFQGRIRRDDWVTQARLLTQGDRAAYEEKFGRL